MKIFIERNRIQIHDIFSSRDLVKNVIGYRKGKHPSRASCILSIDNIDFLKDNFPNLEIDESIEQEFQKRFNPPIKPLQDFTPIIESFKHQIDALELAATKHNNVALLFEMGTGKTKAAIDIGFYHYRYDKVSKILIVAPIAVHQHWKREILANCKYDCGIRVISGMQKKDRQDLILQQNKFPLTWYIINYEALRIFKEELLELNINMIIADESTRIKNFDSKQSKTLREIGSCDSVKYKFILTGTPIWNKPEDIYGQYLFLDPFIFGSSWTNFRNKYLVKGGFHNFETKGYVNLEDLHNKMFSIALRKTKKECLDLPPEIFETRKVKMSEQQEQIYKKAETACYVEIQQELAKSDQPKQFLIQNILVKLIRLQQIANGHFKTIDGEIVRIDSPKIEELCYLLENELEDKKVVVWCRFKDDIHRISERLGDKCVTYHGELSNKTAQKNLDRFQTDPEVKHFIGQIQKGGLGISLTAADTAIFFSNDWSLGNREQAKARNHRKGSEIHESITFIDLVMENTIDEDILTALIEKKEIADIIIDRIIKPNTNYEMDTE